MNGEGLERTIDDLAFNLAGRLEMLVHLDDVKKGYLTKQAILHDHLRMRKWGHDDSACLCFVMTGVVSVDVWAERSPQIVT